MRSCLRSVLVTLALLLAFTTRSSAQNEGWYEDEGSTSSSGSGYSRPKGIPSSQTSEGWGLGLGFGYAVPKGDAAEDGKLSDLVKGVLSPRIDITYGLTKSFVLGAYVGLGGGFQTKDFKRACDMDGVDCRILLLTSGLLAEYRFLPGFIVNPWAGVNVGLDRISTSVNSSVGDYSLKLLGVGFGASVGADVQLGDVGLGPFFSFQVGRYMNAKSKADLPLLAGDELNSEGSIDRRAYHYWLHFGVRVRYQFRP